MIDAFYTFLGNVYDEHQLTPDRIYNCDETGISVVPKTKSKIIDGAPGAWGVCSESSWITSELFLQWFKEFVRFSGATVDRKVLLLLDGHSTHTQNIDLINEARSNGVIILYFPPHTTHRLQVANVAFMRPLSTFYDQ